ncbi:MAG: multidrug effflux MFS transporter [Haemophilus parainfluenzae]|jgi:drug resistance transporter, bcr/cflA subfamily|uniref:Bcr/CflA family efflux transporter n=1 Tax=Haemophilus parainfluenzae ATCC 33392 TaxID=888828 RepID=A0ABD7ZIT7_HAEPA|nr:multidrug effflux MFS transporter [Haemophilus parainfluenzae]EGC71937.1 drug resistance transporter, Bcr/CflA subfamily [Haemophilus parainfluenzae ATCC 33392]KFL99958.1 drug resistance transporter, Bcr/CflA family [Haemophilus parainfluenzae ATCC 33392]MDU2300186.1 multidrug effflux MFS transporter [Haemophilus parainfluenzae]MDU2382724.1 multidrug effflux MFS transporter [Haemophilus parainfluenzae]QQB23949.1 multidrug effflux MFS transporter [Haemophilus parainfluenzae]
MTKANSKLFLVLLLGVLSAFGPFVVDLYLPSLPQLASFFETSASMTQLTLTTAMIGLAVGQLLLGPLSDKFGRKIPLIISLVIYIISTVLIVYAPNIESMIVLRVIQGLSSAGSVVISRAVATDLYRGREMTRFFGLLMTINGIAPIISPILGSLLLEYISWKGVFVFLALIGLVVLFFCFRLKESLSVENRLQGSIFATFSTFGVIIKNRLFMSYVGIESFLLGAMFAYIAASPFILQSFYGLSAFIFSLCFGANGAALVIGSNVGGKMSNGKALAIGVLGFVVVALYTIAVLIIQPHWLFVEIGFFAMLLLMGITFPAISTLAMESERQYAGSASALLGFAPFFLGGVVSPLVGIGNIFYSTALVILACGVLGLAIYWSIRHKIPTSAE